MIIGFLHCSLITLASNICLHLCTNECHFIHLYCNKKIMSRSRSCHPDKCSGLVGHLTNVLAWQGAPGHLGSLALNQGDSLPSCGSRVAGQLPPLSCQPWTQAAISLCRHGRRQDSRLQDPKVVSGGAALPAYQVVGPAVASFADETLLHHLRTCRTQSGARVGWVVPGPARVVGFELIDVDPGTAREAAL